MDYAQLTTDDLLQKRGDLCYAAQACALEGLPMSDGAEAELRAIDDELGRRGVDPRAAHAGG